MISITLLWLYFVGIESQLDDFFLFGIGTHTIRYIYIFNIYINRKYILFFYYYYYYYSVKVPATRYARIMDIYNIIIRLRSI